MPDTAPIEPDHPPARRDPSKREPFFVVGLGASAGGLKALEAFFDHAPPDGGVGYVVVTHQHSGQSSLLLELLAKHTQMLVLQAEDGTPVEPNKVFLPPPGVHLKINSGVLRVLTPPAGVQGRLPIDRFFRSLATDLGHRAIGVVLSGTGTDGTEGVRAIKGEAGMALVQDEATAEHSGMPRSAAATGLVDSVLPPEAMPARILSYVHGVQGVAPSPTGLEFPPPVVERVLLHLLRHKGHDFTHYKKKTIHRRLERRLRLHGLQSIREYVTLIQEHPRELDLLFQELLIGVTSFFRDPAAFSALAAGLEEMLTDKAEGYQVRVWVPGCSTGEEAYSIAIVLRECFERLQRRLSLQIFATDINGEAIDTARQGRYAAGIAADLTPERLSRWFKEADGLYQIVESIREHVIFAPQDMLSDPPFTRLDLISCRNALIYMQSDLQQRLLHTFHYALKPSGVLFLGSSETASGFRDLFAPVDKKWKVFQRRVDSVSRLPNVELRRRKHRPVERRDDVANLTGLADQLLLEAHCPPSVLVTAQGEIVHIRGRTGSYLEPAQGRPNMNVLNMAREGLAPDLAVAMREASSSQVAISRRMRVRTNSKWSLVDVEVTPVERQGLWGTLLLTFRVAPPAPAPAPATPAPPRPQQPAEGAQAPRDDPIREELARTRHHLHATVEELEASNEELKSTNEELQSTNEELQSTNEELETSKEELQSLNEELQTVNAELQEKIGDLSRVNDDMTNLLNSTDIATVFLDDALRIKRFTPQAKGIFQLIETDIGRPITDLASQLRYLDFEADAKEVIRTLIPRKVELRTKTGGYYLTRIMPYRTSDNRLDGLVVTFVDTTLVQGARALARRITEAVRVPVMLLSQDLRVTSANSEFCQLFDLPLEEIQGRQVHELWAGQQLAEALALVEPSGELKGYEFHTTLPRTGSTAIRLNAQRLENPTQFVLSFDVLETPSQKE